MTFIDYSGTLLQARRMVCIFENQQYHIQRYQLRQLGWTGLYGNTTDLYDHVGYIMHLIFNDYSKLHFWERIVTPIMQSFMKRLMFENKFSFYFS